ncbi:MAG: DOMON-like domain-containing protein [Gammaproteobacteria bacterium]|nr:DOMON-like domain-containing protein [Gammaproteobacteria bacterium]
MTRRPALQRDLLRHPRSDADGVRGVRVAVQRRATARRLQVRFAIDADPAALRWPEPQHPPRRRDELWRETCCELFLQRRRETAYREWNCSPSGDWQCYEFARYRAGRDEPAVELPLIECQHETTGWTVLIDVPLAGGRWQLGACAVLVDRDGRHDYWALHHSSPQPDFHRADSWVLTI